MAAEMAAEDNGLLLYNKARSASICAFGFPPGSTEHLMACAKAAASTPPPHRHIGGAAAIAAAEDNKHRRPAVRSQSARTSGGRSIRKRTIVAAAVGAQHGQHLSDSRTSVRSGYSDPRLHEFSSQGIRAHCAYNFLRVVIPQTQLSFFFETSVQNIWSSKQHYPKPVIPSLFYSTLPL